MKRLLISVLPCMALCACYIGKEEYPAYNHKGEFVFYEPEPGNKGKLFMDKLSFTNEEYVPQVIKIKKKKEKLMAYAKRMKADRKFLRKDYEKHPSSDEQIFRSKLVREMERLEREMKIFSPYYNDKSDPTLINADVVGVPQECYDIWYKK